MKTRLGPDASSHPEGSTSEDIAARTIVEPGEQIPSQDISLDTTRNIAAGTELFAQGDPAKDVYVLNDGLVKLTWSSSQGNETILRLCWPGEMLGIMELFSGAQHPVSAITVLRSRLAHASADSFQLMLKNDQGLLAQVQQRLSLELIECTIRLGELACTSAKDRLKQALSTFPWTSLSPHSPRHVLLPIKMKELAQLVAITPEHLSRLLAQLQKEHVLSVGKGSIAILDAQ